MVPTIPENGKGDTAPENMQDGQRKSKAEPVKVSGRGTTCELALETNLAETQFTMGHSSPGFMGNTPHFRFAFAFDRVGSGHYFAVLASSGPRKSSTVQPAIRVSPGGIFSLSASLPEAASAAR